MPCFCSGLFRSGSWTFGLYSTVFSIICPKCKYILQLFLALYHFFLCCCWGRHLSRCKHCSQGSQVLVCLHAVLLWKEREGSDFRYSIRSPCIPLMFITNYQFMNYQNSEEVTRWWGVMRFIGNFGYYLDSMFVSPSMYILWTTIFSSTIKQEKEYYLFPNADLKVSKGIIIYVWPFS